MSDFKHRLDSFEPNDLTALVCVDIQEIQGQIVADLDKLGFKIHTGLFAEDAELKLQTHPYDFVIISEHYNASNLETNPLLRAMLEVSPSQRRRQLITLIGPSLHTDSEMEAWANSVDLVMSVSDMENFQTVIKRAIQRQKAFYTPIREVLQEAGLL